MIEQFFRHELKASIPDDHSIKWSSITDLNTRLQNCKPQEIAIYRVAEDEESLELFKKRLDFSEPAAVVVNRDCGIKNQIVLEGMDWNTALERITQKIYPLDWSKWTLMGVTGTNGKTSTVHFISQLLRATGKNVFSIGTTGNYYNGQIEGNLGLTTPSIVDLSRTLYRLGRPVDIVTMEVSSHALDQKRLSSLEFDISGWTNITHDHLDYHGSFENYQQAKESLIGMSKKFFISNDSNLADKLNGRGIDTAGPINDNLLKHIPEDLKSGFHLLNLELALKMCFEVCPEDKFDATMLSGLTSPIGRFTLLRGKNKVVIVDYAHTPDALENLLKEVRYRFPDKKITTVFGCGGDRDRRKRPEMGRLAQKYSYQCVVTSDNPRYEDPHQIIRDILAGMEGDIPTESDRKDAMERCLHNLNGDEVLVIAGKGHETYQEIRGQRIPFDDILIVKRQLGLC